MAKVEINFTKDWQEEILKEIKKEGIKITKDMRIDTLIIRYFTYLRKKGTGKPYNIHKSKEFSCPDEFKDGLNQIIHILKYGGDISPYLSKQVDELRNDGMFNDWGVLHLHLGKEMEKNNKYIKRTGPLLFIYFKENNAYLINIYKHGDWSKKEVLQLMYDNWSELIDPFILKEVSEIKGLDLEKDYQRNRDSGYFNLIELTDKKENKIVISPPGMGIASSGDAIIDIIKHDDQKTEVMMLENCIIKAVHDIINCKHRNRSDIDLPEVFKFSLIRRNEKWCIKEENTDSIIKVS